MSESSESSTTFSPDRLETSKCPSEASFLSWTGPLGSSESINIHDAVVMLNQTWLIRQIRRFVKRMCLICCSINKKRVLESLKVQQFHQHNDY
jgi:hypothetical protein